MIFEEKKFSIEDVLNVKVDNEQLVNLAKELGLNSELSIVNRWYLFCIKYMVDKGWDIVTAKSFAETITYLVTDVRLNTVPQYYKGQKVIDDVLWNIIHEGYMYAPKKEDFKDIFEDVELLYTQNYDDYTYKTEQLLMKVSIPLRQEFNNVDGNTYTEKLHNLLRKYKE